MRTPLFIAIISALFFQPLQIFSRDETTDPSRAFEKWEKEVAAIEERHHAAQNVKNGIIFVGSSSIRRWTSLKADFPGQPVLNHGFGGSKLSDAVHFVDRLVLAYEPSFIVVYSGGNDINAHHTAEQVFESFCKFVSKVRTQLPSTPIAYISIAGNPKRWAQVAEVIKANALIETYTKQNPSLVFIDVFHPMLGTDGLPRPEIFSEDKLHMNAAGYQLWKEIVGPYLPANGLISETR